MLPEAEREPHQVGLRTSLHLGNVALTVQLCARFVEVPQDNSAVERGGSEGAKEGSDVLDFRFDVDGSGNGRASAAAVPRAAAVLSHPIEADALVDDPGGEAQGSASLPVHDGVAAALIRGDGVPGDVATARWSATTASSGTNLATVGKLERARTTTAKPVFGDDPVSAQRTKRYPPNLPSYRLCIIDLYIDAYTSKTCLLVNP